MSDHQLAENYDVNQHQYSISSLNFFLRYCSGFACKLVTLGTLGMTGTAAKIDSIIL